MLVFQLELAHNNLHYYSIEFTLKFRSFSVHSIVEDPP